jgi:hypothetical protein
MRIISESLTAVQSQAALTIFTSVMTTPISPNRLRYSWARVFKRCFKTELMRGDSPMVGNFKAASRIYLTETTVKNNALSGWSAVVEFTPSRTIWITSTKFVIASLLGYRFPFER